MMAAPRSARVSRVSIDSLPHCLLIDILGKLELAERHRSAPAVCRRWRRAANDPSLLRSLRICLGGTAPLLARVRSLSQWFLQYALPHVLSLSLELHAPVPDATSCISSVAAQLLAACGCAGRLRQLCLRTEGVVVPVDTWAATLTSLEGLELHGPVAFTCGPLRVLRALRELTLHASHIDAG
ncbi:hypothetical protein ABPG75_010705 [Micractinium tetrahymenae]